MTYSVDFETCWKSYPLKKAKFRAYKTWLKLNADSSFIFPDVSVIKKAIQDQKTERAFLKRQNRFCPSWKHFSTWLNAQCWADECELPLRVTKAAENTPKDEMVRALNILIDLGEAEFKDYCRKTKMPIGDIEAVRFKFSGKYDVHGLTKGIG